MISLLRYFKILPFLTLSACSSVMYQGSTQNYYDPHFFFLEPKDLMVPSENRQMIHAWYFESKTLPSKGTFVFFHGNAENLTSHFAMLSWLPFSGYSYVIFDYPGYGKSKGTPDPQSTVEAGKAVLRYVNKEIDLRPLIVLGQSLGGIIALRTIQELKNEIPLRAAVIDSSFNSYQKMARRVLARSWLTWILQPLAYVLFSDRYAPEPLSDLSPLPLIFIAGDHDQVVDVAFSSEMYAQAQEPKKLWLVRGGFHGSSFMSEGRSYRRKLTEFLENCLPPAKDSTCF